MKNFVKMGVLKEQDFNISEGLDNRYYEEDLKQLYELDYLCSLYGLGELQTPQYLIKIDKEKIKAIEIDDYRVKYKIKNLIVDGSYDLDNRANDFFKVISELLKAKHSFEEIAYTLLNKEWEFGKEVSDQHESVKIGFIERGISAVIEELKVRQQANKDIEVLIKILAGKGWYIDEYNNYSESSLPYLNCQKGDSEIQIKMSSWED